MTSLKEQLEQIKGRGKSLGSAPDPIIEASGSLPGQQGGRVSSFPRPPATTSDWHLPVERFSASSFALLQECPRAWQQRYLLKVEEPSHERQVLGSAFHASMAFNWNNKYLTEKDLPADNVIEFFHDLAWPNAVKERGNVVWDKGQDKQKEMGELLIRTYLEKMPHVDPEYTELNVRFNLDDIPIPIVGIADCVQKGSLPTIDLKTAARAMTYPKSRWKIQGWVYQLALEKPLEWHVITKTKTPTISVFSESAPTAYAKRHLTYLANLANKLYTEYGLEKSWPATGIGHDWVCKSCFHKSTCPAWD